MQLMDDKAKEAQASRLGSLLAGRLAWPILGYIHRRPIKTFNQKCLQKAEGHHH